MVSELSFQSFSFRAFVSELERGNHRPDAGGTLRPEVGEPALKTLPPLPVSNGPQETETSGEQRASDVTGQG